MKQILTLLSTALITQLSAQAWTEPEYSETYTAEEIREQLQDLRGVQTRADRDILPSRIDHSESKYMRPAFSQGSSGSCGSASRISYLFAYELNNYRDLDASQEENIYPSFFTWLLTGQNSGKHSMAMFNGIPNSLVYGGDQASHLFHEDKIWGLGWPTDAKGANYGWMQGYDRWKHAATNRLEKTVDVKLDSREKIEYIKHWFHNHMGDESFNAGGILGGGVASSGWTVSTIPEGSHRAGEKIISKFGPQIDHGVTWAGYDDSISFDLNSNGTIEEEEKGAIIMLNSWGANWGNSGSAYIPYKLLIDNGRWAEFYYIRKDYRPDNMLRIKMNYSERCNLKLSIGIAGDVSSAEPVTSVAAHHFIYAGNSAIPMLGTWQDGEMHSESMEFALDLSDLTFGIDTRDPFKYFLIVETDSDANGTGEVEELQVVQYNNYSSDGLSYDSTFIDADMQNVAISGASQKIYIPITMPSNGTAEPEYIYIPDNRISVESVNTENSSGQSNNVLDNDESTIWHSRWSTGTDPFPHDITLALDSTFRLNALEYLPRQDGSSNGRIAQYEIYVSNSKDDIGTLVKSGEWENNSSVKRSFFEAAEGSYITLRSLSSGNGGGHTCVAELNLMAQGSSGGATAIDRPIIAKGDLKFTLNNRSITITSASAGKAKVKLYLPNGREVFSRSQELVAGKANIALSGKLGVGVYIANISINGLVKSQQIILQ